MMFGQPGDQKVEAALPALGTDVHAPARPASNQAAKAQQAQDFRIGGIFQQADGGPIAVQPANGQLAIQ